MVVFTSDLFKWPEKKGTSSTVILEPKDWQDEGILVPHEPFRWYHQNILEIVKSMQIGQGWKIKLFKTWFSKYYMEAIHHHHEAEEEIYNPGITAKGGVLPPSITTDHKTIMADIATIQSYLVKLESNEQLIPEFVSFMEKFIINIEAHFADEENKYPEVLRACGMTQAEEKKIVDTILQGLGLEGNKVFLPPVLYVMCIWKGEAGMQEFAKAVPPPIQMLCQNCWLPDFYHQNLRVIEALKGDVAYEATSPSCGLCVLQ